MKYIDYDKKNTQIKKNLEHKNRKNREDCEQIITDVLGSYTGTPYDSDEPIQDVDDL